MSVSGTAVGALEPEYYADVLIEIRAGSGEEDAELFVGELLEMYKNFSQNQGWSMQIVMQQGSDGEHPKLVLLRVVGGGAYSVLKYETGIHRVQRAPDSEGQGMIKTSTASVVIMPIPGAVRDQRRYAHTIFRTMKRATTGTR